MKTTDHSVTERFLRYISYDTQSKEEEEQVPSTKKQLEFSILLAAELNGYIQCAYGRTWIYLR